MRKNCFLIVVAIFVTLLFTLPCFAQEAEEAAETSIYYTVQEGDTLWGLSQKFSDSPFEWPDLWKNNENIANPHWIYPGQKIRLYYKKDYIPKPKAKISPVELGESQAEEAPPVYFRYTSINKAGFIKKKPAESCGAIFKVDNFSKTISIGDTVYIRYKEGCKLEKGSFYTLFEYLEPTRSTSVNKEIGYQHYMKGVLKISSLKKDFATGIIIKAYRGINLEDRLMPYVEKSPQIEEVPSVSNMSGVVTIPEEHNMYFGENAIAFIDKGSKDGIKAGQYYSIYTLEKGKLEKGQRRAKELMPVDFAKLIVLFTEEDTATVLVIKSLKGVFPGTKFRTPIEEEE